MSRRKTMYKFLINFRIVWEVRWFFGERYNRWWNKGFWVWSGDEKIKSSKWHTTESPCPKKVQMSKSKMKLMLVIFSDFKGVIHKEFVPLRQMATDAFYVEVLKQELHASSWRLSTFEFFITTIWLSHGSLL